MIVLGHAQRFDARQRVAAQRDVQGQAIPPISRLLIPGHSQGRSLGFSACRGGAQCAERPSHPRGGEAGTICILLWVMIFGCQLLQIFHCAHFISKNGNSCFQ